MKNALSYEEWRRTHSPIAGGDTEGDATATSEETTETTEETTTEETTTEETGGDSALSVLQAENQRLKREAAQHATAQRKAAADAKKAEDARKAEQGEWRKLAEERAEEITQLKAEIATRDREKAESEQRQTAFEAAQKLSFKRPKRAFALLVDELGAEQAHETLASSELTEAALRRMAKAEPELWDRNARTGAPVNSGAGGTNKPDPAQEHNQLIAQLMGGRPTDEE